MSSEEKIEISRSVSVVFNREIARAEKDDWEWGFAEWLRDLHSEICKVIEE